VFFLYIIEKYQKQFQTLFDIKDYKRNPYKNTQLIL